MHVEYMSRFLCLAVACASVGVPIWAYYDANGGYYEVDKGYFSPFKVCKQLGYNREKCGSDVSRFRPSSMAMLTGILAIGSCLLLAGFCVLSVIQLAMISSRDKVVLQYKSNVMLKAVLALLSCILSAVATTIFALEIDSGHRQGFRITKGISFYLQLSVIFLTIGLFVMALMDVIYTKKAGGDPTVYIDSSAENSTTFNNPGFREGRGGGRNGISVTDASGKPYSGIRNGAGSVQSMSTTLTSVSNGSTIESVTRSPLRSSLKKPRPRGEHGIQNPGFSGSGHSPPMHRNGSVKKVRIQTHSTEV
ncbi:hypothetical protein ACFFRR_010823 [Megaselia abdita]